MRTCLFSLLVCLFAAQAFAADVPDYDTNAGCKEIANFGGGGSAQLELHCRKTEAQARDRIAGMEVSASAMRNCNEIASFGGSGNYGMLEQCIKDEMAAEKALAQ